MKSIFPSFEEIRVLAHVEQLYEQHQNRLVQPLHVKVTDAAGKITECDWLARAIATGLLLLH